jgi:hypothetical protein
VLIGFRVRAASDRRGERGRLLAADAVADSAVCMAAGVEVDKMPKGEADFRPGGQRPERAARAEHHRVLVEVNPQLVGV